MAASVKPEPMKIEVDGDICTVTIDLRYEMGKSKSGNSMLVASTGGNTLIGQGVKLGVNAYKPL